MKKINLKGNLIKEIPFLKNLIQLEEVNFSCNKIVSLDEAAENLPMNLKVINIDNNLIQSIFSPFYLSFFKQLKSIRISSNPFVKKLQLKNINYRLYCYWALGANKESSLDIDGEYFTNE